MLTLDETIDDAGAPLVTRAAFEGGALRLFVGAEDKGGVTLDALHAVMTRYGKPLADGIEMRGPSLDLGGGRALRVLRHRALYDVIARDFAVLEWPGREPVAELARTVAAALLHLAGARARAARPPAR